jgi:hypothetical protein
MGRWYIAREWPHLFSFAKNDSICLKEALGTSYLTVLFHLPIAEEAMVQPNLFQAMLQSLVPGNGYDSWFISGTSRSTEVSQVYKTIMGTAGTISALKWMWDGCCQHKHNVFFWLLTHNRLNTRAIAPEEEFHVG